MEFRHTLPRAIGWMLAGWFASASVAGADPDPAAAVSGTAGGVHAIGSWSLPIPVDEQVASSLYLEYDYIGYDHLESDELGHGLLGGQGWVDSDLDRLRLDSEEAPLTLRFLVTLGSGERFELAFEALDGEPLTLGTFVSSSSSVRINSIDWAEGGDLLALDADFEAHFDPDSSPLGEPGRVGSVFGRLLWNLSGDPEEPPFVGLTDSDYELAYSGSVTLTACGGRGRCDDNTTTSGDVTQSGTDGHIPGSGGAPSDPASPRRDGPGDEGSTPVDRIPYSSKPTMNPGEARDAIAHEIAELAPARSRPESVAERGGSQAPDRAASSAAAMASTPQVHFAGWPVPALGNRAPADTDLAIADGELPTRQDFEIALEAEPEVDFPTELEWLAGAEDWLRAALVRAIEERLANDELAGTEGPIQAILRDASVSKPFSKSTRTVASTPEPLPRRTALEALLRGWLLESSAAMTELLEGVSAFWIEASS